MDRNKQREANILRGKAEGILYGIACRTGMKEFDQDRWESLYGSVVLHRTYGFMEKDRVEGEPPMIEWEDETKQLRLKSDVELVYDRSGIIIFEDGTAVIGLRGGKRWMFTLQEGELEYVSHLFEASSEIRHQAHDDGPALS